LINLVEVFEDAACLCFIDYTNRHSSVDQDVTTRPGFWHRAEVYFADHSSKTDPASAKQIRTLNSNDSPRYGQTHLINSSVVHTDNLTSAIKIDAERLRNRR
jgi:hypothetical protein